MTAASLVMPPLTTRTMHEWLHIERTQAALTDLGPDFYLRLRQYRALTRRLLEEAQDLQDRNAISAGLRGLQLSEDMIRTRMGKLLAILAVDSNPDPTAIPGLQPEERKWLSKIIDAMIELRERLVDTEDGP